MNKVPVSFLRLVIIVLFGAGQVFAAPTIVAKVGGVPITQAEVTREMDRIMPLRVSFHGRLSQDKLDAMKQEAIDVLVERAYKICYAIDNEISVSTDKVEAALAEVKAKYKTEDQFLVAASKETVAGFRASIYRDLLAKKAESVAVEEKIVVLDDSVESYYQNNKQMYFMTKQYRASHILITVDPSSNDEERAVLLIKAEALLSRAKAGEDFYNLAYYNSDDRSKYVGGDLGLFHEEQVVESFSDALKGMQVGEISDLVRTRFGYHIIKLVQVNQPRQLTFAEMKEKIKKQMMSKQRDQIYQQWLDGLKVKYQLELVGE